jgi:hypothetical protein
MNHNHLSKAASRKSFLSFGVLSPQPRAQQQELIVQPNLEKQVQQQATFRLWKVRGYEA